MSETKTIDVTTAAQILGTSERTIRNMIQRGSLPGAYKLDPNARNSGYRIPITAIEHLQAKRQQPTSY